ncbi:MAG: general secretion pathway protein GspD [Hydrogenophilales bacterium]|nr:general secretion pathway protein GspD [Hydrogenophilales bacterium]
MMTLKRISVGLIVLALLTACTAGRQAFDDGQSLIQEGKIEEGLAELERALKENARSVEYKTYYLRQKELYIAHLLVKADNMRATKQYSDAEAAYRRVFKFDPKNQHANDGLEGIRNDRRRDEVMANAEKALKAGKTDEARAIARSVLAEAPQHEGALKMIRALDEKTTQQKPASSGLGAAFKKPITLEFRDANLKAIIEVISRATQINFIFDRDVRPDLKSTIFVKNTTIEDVINLLMVTNQLDKRVLNENTVLIYPNTPAKNKDYQELIVRAFYLANADVKQTLNMIKTLVKTRDVFIDEKLSMLVMKDTPEAIRLAEKLIVAQDRAEPEVMLEVEVLEVKRSRLLDLGIQFPNTFTALNIANQTTQSTTGGVVVSTSAQTQNTVTIQTLKNLTGGSIAISPNLQLNLKKEDGDVQTLANPRIRVKNKEKAKIHIGEKVPVITTTSTANVGVAESVSYLDVGLKLDVEPQVYLDNDVGIKVGLEVSSIVRELRGQTGSLTYQVGTRNASTVLRLKDGETQILAGLISDEDRQSASKIPGLGDLPLIGRLFSTHRDETTKTEIVLLITPRIVRNITRLDAAQSEFSSGTEGAVGSASLSLRPPASAAPALTLQGQGTPAPMPSAAQPLTVPSPPVAAPLTLSMTTVPSIGRGQEFNLVVQATSSGEVKSLGFDLVYDPAHVEVVRVTEAAFLKQGNAATEFIGNPVEGADRLTVNINRTTGGARGTGAVAVVVLRALTESGATQVSIENAKVLDPTGKPVGVNLPAPTTNNIAP